MGMPPPQLPCREQISFKTDYPAGIHAGFPRPTTVLLSSLLSLFNTASCRNQPDSPPLNPDMAVLRIATTEFYYLAGRATPFESPWPDAPPFKDGSLVLGQNCSETASPATASPCAVELWRSDSGYEMLFVRTGDEALFRSEEKQYHAVASWRRITGTLAECTGDPLAIPPAGDTEAFRTLKTRNEGWQWILTFSGANPCHLLGDLVLEATGDSVDPRQIQVDGLSWNSGGRLAAAARLRSLRRFQALRQWDELTKDQRILTLNALGKDPDHQADLVLEALLAKDPASALDIRKAIQRRARQEEREQPGD